MVTKRFLVAIGGTAGICAFLFLAGSETLVPSSAEGDAMRPEPRSAEACPKPSPESAHRFEASAGARVSADAAAARAPRPRDAIYDPNTYNPLDRELVESLDRDASTLELVEKQQSQDARIRVAARAAFYKNRDRRAAEIESWLRTYQDSRLASERKLALRGAKLLGVDRYKKLIETIATKDADESARAEAFVVLGAFADDATRVAGLRDPAWAVRNATLASLSANVNPSAEVAAAVRECESDCKPIVQSRAQALASRWTQVK